MANRTTSRIAKALFFSFYEFLLIIVPVGVYVCIEAVHKNDIWYFFMSPEWSIASIFLAFQGVALYVKYLNKSNKKLNFPVIGFMVLISVIATIIATINISVSLNFNGSDAIIVRTIQFILTSILFVSLVSGALFSSFKENQRRGDG